ncbi:hypothetical protein ACHAWO_013446 [Cyclotella atomus]|uniref:Uncharacterized protein n=1 Tax=Cyclotella atomus TaxID=382360 RepID=A0ABD3NR22_9STRA
MNEWGEYSNKDEQCPLEDDGVIEAIRKNSPAITSVFVDIRYGHLNVNGMVMCNLDYAPVGQSLGSSSRVQHLRLFAHSYDSEDHQLKTFWEALPTIDQSNR